MPLKFQLPFHYEKPDKAIEPLETKSYYDNVSMESIFGAGIEGELGAFLNAVVGYYLFAVCSSVHNAISLIADEFSQIRPVLQDKKTKEYVMDHEALELLEINDMRFNEGQVKREMMISMLIANECFPVIGGNVNYDPVSLFHYPACNASVVQGNDGYVANILASYQNVITNYTRVPQSRIYNNLHTFIFEDPPHLGQMMFIVRDRRRNYLRGQSDLESIYYQATMKFYTGMHNSGIVKKASRPSGLWNPTAPLSQEQYEEFSTNIKRGLTGPENSGKNIVTQFPVNYQNLLLTTRDMDFINLINQSDKDVYNTYRIPLPLVTTETMTLSNYANSVYALYDLAVLPKAKFLFHNLGDFILARYKDGERFRLVIDDREIPALKQRLLERGQAMRNIFAFSQDEIRNIVGYEETGDDTGKVVYIPATYIEAGAKDEYAIDPFKLEGQQEPEPEEPVDEPDDPEAPKQEDNKGPIEKSKKTKKTEPKK